MLRINRNEEQAIRLAMQLALDGGQLTLADLAAREKLPEPTVAKLLNLLRQSDVVQAIRGRRGGYMLARTAAEISVADVLRSLNPDAVAEAHCISDPASAEGCPRVADCGLRSVFRHLHLQVAHLLEKTSLADLLRAEREVHRHVIDLWPRPEPSVTLPVDEAAPPVLAQGESL